MTADRIADALTERLKERLSRTLYQYGGQKRDHLRRMLSVPVQYVGSIKRPGTPTPIGRRPGPGFVGGRRVGAQGRRVIRSKRGEPPRKEFGDLYNSILHEGGETFNTVYIRVGSDQSSPGPHLRGRSRKLEYAFRRPHIVPLFRIMQQQIMGVLRRL